MRVPGSPLEINHPFSWYATVRDKRTGKEWTYWINGPQLTREAVAAYVENNFHGVELLKAEFCHAMPGRILQPIPPHHFQFGILEAMDAEDRKERERIESTLVRKPYKPIARRSVLR